MKAPSGLTQVTTDDLTAMQEILSAGVASGSPRYFAHPGDLAWWAHHPDPAGEPYTTYWLGDGVVVVLDDPESPSHGGDINIFALPDVERAPIVEWAQGIQRGKGNVAWVSDEDEEMRSYLQENSYVTDWAMRRYLWDLRQKDVPAPNTSFELRPIKGETEANERRRASHAAFKSKMDPDAHLQRYLRFMRSPVYDRERDLVAVTAGGRVASFIVWWPDQSGVAQIEPFGTHPEFQRQGSGKALLHFALERMRDEGVERVRVCTDVVRPDAMGFYEGVGFEDVGGMHWWAPAIEG